MSLYGLLSDQHLSDRPPSSCTDTYLDDLLQLLSQTVLIQRERSLDAMIWAGDVFHSKTPGRTSHRLIQRLQNLISAYSCQVLIVPGNHDVQFDNLGTIFDTQPLGVLLRTSGHVLAGWHNDGRVYGVPWLQKWTDEAVSEAFRSWREEPRFRDDRPCLVVAHAPLYPPGQELKWENYPADKWAEAMDRRGYVFYGHVHEPHGVWQAGGVTFCNNGALSRGSLHEYNLTRQVGMTIWDSDTGAFEFVPLDAKPASKVFRLKEAAEIRDLHVHLDAFLESVGSANLQVMNVETVTRHIRSLGLPAPDTELAEELLAWAVQESR